MRCDKVLCSMLAGVMLVFFVIAYGSTTPLEIILLGHPAHLGLVEPIIEQFNAEQDEIKVVLTKKESSPDVILSMYLAGELPDIIESGGRFTHDYGPKGLMADLTPFVEREGKQFLADFIPATMPDNRIDGCLYSLPAFLQIEGMFLNPDVLAATGVPEPQVGWTWEDLRALGRRARRMDAEGRFELWGVTAGHPFQFDWVLIAQAGGCLLTEDLQVTTHMEPIRSALGYVVELVDDDIARFRGVHSDAPNANDAWGHKTAFVADATYRQDTWNNLESPMKVAPPLRYQKDSQPCTVFSDRSWAIMNVTPERQEAAWKVVKYLTRADNAARFAVALGYPVASRSAMQNSVFQAYMRARPNMRIWAETYTTIQSAQLYPARAAALVFDIVAPLAQNVRRKTMSVEEFVQDVQNRLPALITERLLAN